MSRLSRLTVAIVLLGLLTAAPAAAAPNAVFGGTTSAREFVVLVADARAQKLRSVVLAWEAECGDGSTYPVSVELSVEKREPGFDHGALALVVTRNAKGRFAGKQLAGQDLGGGITAAIAVDVRGRLKPRAASGTLSAEVRIVDATGNEVAACRTGSVRFQASRRAGVIYAGVTSQDEPVVVRLNSLRIRISNLMFSWHSEQCNPPGLLRFHENYGVRLVRGRFGGSFTENYTLDTGGRRDFDYTISGRVARKTVRGSFSIDVLDTAADGTQSTCDTGTVTWRASTG